MHVSGSPGSHVVIRCHDDDFPNKHEETLGCSSMAQYSKGKHAGRVPVSLTLSRCCEA